MNAVTEVMDELRKALTELEDCRARSADLRTMLEQVTRDRDHVEESLVRLEAQRDEARSALAACPDCAMWAERSARWHDDMQRVERERDEARAEVERLREDYDSVLEANVGLLDGAPYVDARAAFRRGAEAMREACAVALLADGLVLSRERAANVVRALPIPEEP